MEDNNMNNNRGNGVLPEIDQIRSYDYEVACGAVSATQEFPEEYEINERYLGVLKNQEVYNCCVGCVMSSLAEVFDLIEQYGNLEDIPENEWKKIDDREEVEFSEFWAYAALRSGYEEEGMYVGDAIKNWGDKGILPKKYFNLRAEVPSIIREVEKFPELYEKAKLHKPKSYASLNYAIRSKKDRCIKDALMKYRHGLLGVSDKHFGGSHCIMVVGWNDKTNKYKIKNSWGTDWGDKNGVGEIPKSSLNDVYLILDEELIPPFIDVNKTDWFYKAVKNMYFANLVKGIDDTHFEPLRNITRAEITAILHRLVVMIDERIQLLVKVAKEKGSLSKDFLVPSLLSGNREIPFKDVSPTAWYYEDIKAIYSLNLIKGMTETEFEPEENLTRAELATLCVRIHNLIRNIFNDILTNSGKRVLSMVDCIEGKEFQDVAKEDWYYKNVKDCYQLGLMNGVNDENFAPEENTTRAEVATILNRLTKEIDQTSNETRSRF